MAFSNGIYRSDFLIENFFRIMQFEKRKVPIRGNLIEKGLFMNYFGHEKVLKLFVRRSLKNEYAIKFCFILFFVNVDL